MVISNAIGTFRAFLPARISRHIAAASANRNVTSITAAHVTDAIKDEANAPPTTTRQAPRGEPGKRQATRPIRHSRESEAGDDCREIAEDHLMGVPAHSLERARRRDTEREHEQPEGDCDGGKGGAQQEKRSKAVAEHGKKRAAPLNGSCYARLRHSQFEDLVLQDFRNRQIAIGRGGCKDAPRSERLNVLRRSTVFARLSVVPV